MKKFLKRVTIALICIANLVFPACNSGENNSAHECIFDQKIESADFLYAEATCKHATKYYYSCLCGKAGEEIFYKGKPLSHEYVEIVADKYKVKEATCYEGGVYYKSCVSCGLRSTTTFETGTTDNHQFNQKVEKPKYIKVAPTLETEGVYYKSCKCGLAGTETFVGEKLRMYMAEEKVDYQPTSLTVTLYDSENSVYGFTYNTTKESPYPVIQVRVKGEERWNEYLAEVEQVEGSQRYTTKVEVALQPNTAYEYRAYDKYVDIGTEIVAFNTKNPKAKTFTFSHVSDTQGYPTYFNAVLQQTSKTSDFLLHTGDVVEDSTTENEWTEMLNGNFSYVSKIPIMAMSGNHETTYKAGTYETYKHFHYKMPKQESMIRGFYYSFVYGDVKFIMLNTNNIVNTASWRGIEEAQYNWLIDELENNTCKWTIVSMHNPLYSVEKYGSDPSRNTVALLLQSQLQGVFAQYGVDIVLQGHDHCVSRTYPIDAQGKPKAENWETENGISYSVDPSGVIYVMDGTSGAQARSPISGYNASLYEYALKSNASTWAEYTFCENKVTVTVKYSETGKVQKTWGIKKTTL